MFPTVEVRWFRPGSIPAEVETWFGETGGELRPATSRVDRYLRLDGDIALGIKLREGRIDVKRRQGSGKLVQLHQHVAGRLEHWRKWSSALPPVDANQAGYAARHGSWIAVDKARLLRRYRVTSTGSVVVVPPTELPGQACDWELTQVQIEGSPWWTVAFEAFGRESCLEQRFHAVVAQVLAAGVPPILGDQDSLGYPEWLALLDRLRR